MLTKKSLTSLLVEPVSAYLELTVATPVKNFKDVNQEQTTIRRARRATSSLIKIARAQRVSPEVNYQMKPIRPIARPKGNCYCLN